MTARINPALGVFAPFLGLLLLICGLRFGLNGLTWIGATLLILGVGLLVLTAPRHGRDRSSVAGTPVPGGVDLHRSTDCGAVGGDGGGGGV